MTERVRALSGFRCYRRLGVFSGLRHHLVGLGDAHDFFDRRFALGYATPAILSQRDHPLGDGALLELAAVSFLHDQLSQRLGDHADFINRSATLISSVTTLLATLTAKEFGPEL